MLVQADGIKILKLTDLNIALKTTVMDTEWVACVVCVCVSANMETTVENINFRRIFHLSLSDNACELDNANL